MLSENFADSYSHDKIYIVYKRSLNSMGNSWFVSHDMVLYLIRNVLLLMFSCSSSIVPLQFIHFSWSSSVVYVDVLRTKAVPLQPFKFWYCADISKHFWSYIHRWNTNVETTVWKLHNPEIVNPEVRIRCKKGGRDLTYHSQERWLSTNLSLIA